MSTPFLLWCFIICIITGTGIHTATIGPSLLPTAIHSTSIGYDNETNVIWIFGGRTKWLSSIKSLISFNLSIWNESNATADHSSDITYHIVSSAQAYVQNQNIVYVIDYNIKKLLTFDVSTKYLSTINTNPSQYLLSQYGCLASIDNWIIYTYEDETYILTISTQSWKLSGNPLMLEKRYKHSCIIEPNGGYLYVIGGDVGFFESYQDSIEKLYVKDIININQYTFTNLIEHRLSHRKSCTRAILYETDIYVIGGTGDNYYDDIDLIDTTTDSVILWGKLHEGIAITSAVLIGTRFYIFGGQDSAGDDVNYWQYFDVFSTCNYKIYFSES